MANKPMITSDQVNLKLMIEGEEDNPVSNLPLRRKGFDDDREFTKFIKNIERLVRSSIEYKDWTRYIKDVLGYSACALTDEKSAEITLEIHHHPINLYTICKGLTTSYINKEKEFCSYDIALECINMHFSNRIGYIPLISTLHEKYHNGFLRIPIDLCHGEWRWVMNHLPLDEIDTSIISELAQVKLEDMKQEWSRGSYQPKVAGE